MHSSNDSVLRVDLGDVSSTKCGNAVTKALETIPSLGVKHGLTVEELSITHGRARADGVLGINPVHETAHASGNKLVSLGLRHSLVGNSKHLR